MDEVKGYEKGEEGEVARWMRAQKFELGILLPNSFRSAWMLWRGAVRRRLAYARGGRGWLLTDRVQVVRRSAAGREEDRRREAAIRELGGGRVRVGNGYEPVATIEYYLELVRYLGGMRKWGDGGNDELGIMNDERRMELGVSEEERREGEGALRELGVGGDLRFQISDFKIEEGRRELGDAQWPAPLKRAGFIGGGGYVVMVPGANFGGSKCWEAGRYAEVARRLVREYGVWVVLVGSAGERGVLEEIERLAGKGNDEWRMTNDEANLKAEIRNPGMERAEGRISFVGGANQPAPLKRAGFGGQSGDWRSKGVVSLLRANGGKGVTVGGLKEVVRGARLMVCNDTGPRHMAVAFGVPLVTLFGPTDPVWAETFYERERIVRVDVPCGPCQLKVCPIDHRCMKGISVEMVMGAVGGVLRGQVEA